MEKDNIITFVENHDHKNAHFTGEEIVFSLPYSKIRQAAEFCERERLDFVYLGFKRNAWQLSLSGGDLTYRLKVTKDGLAPEVSEAYIYVITEVPCL